ncbi:DinB family protein [Paenibacillus roseipurpureus]|uniref:DinB family protein n=1 Tax=Paenibacillus roseopurpureus TaxID=2918901 RepID=A0AA96LQ86_9BACL|nr:DinB family protein [Paenibacillus sp. MBLB1832]WNR43828.1 DinB family protein [Paenibacillus sp. MBLB1832]
MKNFEENLYFTREQLISEISHLPNEVFNRKSDTNKWSIAQICHHLWKTETLFTKAILFGLKQNKRTKTERKPIEHVLDRSKFIRAPEIAEPGTGPFYVVQLIQLLNDSRIDLLGVLNKMDDKSILEEIAVKHPMFDDLSLDQWVELLYLHEQRHIQQIKDHKSRPDFKI